MDCDIGLHRQQKDLVQVSVAVHNSVPEFPVTVYLCRTGILLDRHLPQGTTSWMGQLPGHKPGIANCLIVQQPIGRASMSAERDIHRSRAYQVGMLMRAYRESFAVGRGRRGLTQEELLRKMGEVDPPVFPEVQPRHRFPVGVGGPRASPLTGSRPSARPSTCRRTR